MMNRKRELVEIKKMNRQLSKEYNKFYEQFTYMGYSDDETKEAWNQTYKEDKIRHLIELFNNANPILLTGAIYMSIMTQLENKHIKKITVIPNIKYYTDNIADNKLNIECLFSNCVGKHKPYLFWSWIPAKHLLTNNNTNDKNERAYIFPLCEIHSMKVRKNFKLLSDYIKSNIHPLIESFQKNEL